MVSQEFQTGDPVWAKMKGYPPWPARIAKPKSDSKQPKHKKASFVMFFGTGDHAWILNENIIPHSESVLAEAKNRKKNTLTYQNGIDALVSYSKSFKKIKPTKLIKKKNDENMHVTKSKIVKVIDNNSKKNERKILTSKSLLKNVHRKRSFQDFNGGNSDDYYPPSKSLKLSNINHTHISPIVNDIPAFGSDSSFDPNEILMCEKEVNPDDKMFGFIGLGLLGKQIVKRLLETGHKICIWNKTSSQCETFLEMGAKKARYPADLIVNCEVTFCCVSDPEATKAVIFGENGVLNGLDQANSLGLQPKGYVEMSNIDPSTSQKICEAVLMKSGLYLEAPVCGTSKCAEEGNLVIVAAGDYKLFKISESCFYSMGKMAYYVSCNIGDGTLMTLLYSAVSSTGCASMAEAMVLLERMKIQKTFLNEFLGHAAFMCSDLNDKFIKMAELDFDKITALKLAQKDMGLSLSIANDYRRQMWLTSACNETYKRGKLRNYSNEDRAAVYKVVKY